MDSKFIPNHLITGILLLGGASLVSAAVRCSSYQVGDSPLISTDVWSKTVVEDLPGQCDGIVANFHCATIEQSCDDVDGKIRWRTVTTPFCNAGDFEHAWGVATDNNWGAICCTITECPGDIE